MKLKDILEGFYTSVKVKDRMGTPVNCEIFKDPTRKELNYAHSTYAVQGDEVAGYIDPSGHLYIWTPYLLHHTVFESGRIPQNSVSVRLHYDASDCHVIVTDSTKRTTWHHNPEIVDLINNSYVNKLFNVVEISYYDEDIVGDWNELNESLLEYKLKDYVNKKSNTDGDLLVKDAVKRFSELKNSQKLNGPEKDIAYWMDKPFQDFLYYTNRYIKPNSNRTKKKQEKSGSIKVLNDSRFNVTITLTKEACQNYGSGTKWCISGTSYNEFKRYFNEGSSTIFIVYDKQHEEKFAVIFGGNGYWFIQDSNDDEVDEEEFVARTNLDYSFFEDYYNKYEDVIEQYRQHDNETEEHLTYDPKDYDWPK